MRTMGPVGIPQSRTRTAESAGILTGYAVKQGAADNGAAKITVAGTRSIGIAANVSDAGTAVGDALLVVEQGETVALAGAAINAGQYLKVDATSRLIPVAGGATTSEEVIARAQSSAANAGDELVVRVLPFVLTTN